MTGLATPTLLQLLPPGGPGAMGHWCSASFSLFFALSGTQGFVCGVQGDLFCQGRFLVFYFLCTFDLCIHREFHLSQWFMVGVLLSDLPFWRLLYCSPPNKMFPSGLKIAHSRFQVTTFTTLPMAVCGLPSLPATNPWFPPPPISLLSTTLSHFAPLSYGTPVRHKFTQ